MYLQFNGRIPYSGKFSMVQIFCEKASSLFRRNFCGFYFCGTWDALTTPLPVDATSSDCLLPVHGYLYSRRLIHLYSDRLEGRQTVEFFEKVTCCNPRSSRNSSIGKWCVCCIGSRPPIIINVDTLGAKILACSSTKNIILAWLPWDSFKLMCCCLPAEFTETTSIHKIGDSAIDDK